VNVIEPGNSTITGSVANAGTGNVRVNLYIMVEGKGRKEEKGETKRGIIGSYVLLAATVPNDNGEYRFENLPEGSYKVDVEIDEYESEASSAINLSNGETRSNIDFEVDGATGTVAPKIVTGTVETWHAASLQICPNPFTDAVHIVGAYRNTPLQIFNASGAIVHTKIISSPDEIIRLEHLPVGVYFFRLEKDGKVKTEKMIKIQ